MSKRGKTKYPGVWFTIDNTLNERVYYIRYRKQGRQIEEKVGRQFQDDMTPAKANYIRMERITGKQLSNSETRRKNRAKRTVWTINKIWDFYKENNPKLKGYIRMNVAIIDI